MSLIAFKISIWILSLPNGKSARRLIQSYNFYLLLWICVSFIKPVKKEDGIQEKIELINVHAVGAGVS